MDINKIRAVFPILEQKIYNRDLIYFDNAATTQKPQIVIDEISKIYKEQNSNIHRGANYLSDNLTQRFENARKNIQQFINAKSNKEVIFTSGTTQSINTVAYSFGEKHIKEGDEIIISEIEHHANIVPWQLLCNRKKAKLKVIPVNDDCELLLDKYEELLTPKTKLVAVNKISNSIGSVNNIEKVIELAHKNGSKVLIDAAQSIQHEPTDVQKLDCDFLVFSGHKLYGPNAVGVLYGKEEILNEMPPFISGGEMIDKVSFCKTTFNELPFKFEAGTPNYVEAIGLSTAIDYIKSIGFKNIMKHEAELHQYAYDQLSKLESIKIYGKKENTSGLVSFNIEGIHFFDAGQIIDKFGIQLRTGSHCAHPIMERLGISGTIRASFSFYNTKEEIDKLVEAIERVILMLR
jgi:cysteine desulfurase/selenocysteine lyase